MKAGQVKEGLQRTGRKLFVRKNFPVRLSLPIHAVHVTYQRVKCSMTLLINVIMLNCSIQRNRRQEERSNVDSALATPLQGLLMIRASEGHVYDESQLYDTLSTWN